MTATVEKVGAAADAGLAPPPRLAIDRDKKTGATRDPQALDPGAGAD